MNLSAVWKEDFEIEVDGCRELVALILNNTGMLSQYVIQILFLKIIIWPYFYQTHTKIIFHRVTQMFFCVV